jgi:hypothetical protein
MRRGTMTFTLSALAVLLWSGVACDSGEPAGTTTEPDPTGQEPADDTPIVGTPTDDPSAEPPIELPVDTPSAVAYPEGPFGTGYFEVVKDLEFFNPWTGEAPRLSDYFQSPDVSVLLITSAAGWCTACMYEAWDLVTVYEKYKDRGLEVLYTLYEDTQGRPIFQDGASDDRVTSDIAFYLGWIENLGKRIGLPVRVANYPVLVDPDFVLAPYYNEGATPLTLIVRTSDMRILYRQVGYSAGTVEQMVRGHL